MMHVLHLTNSFLPVTENWIYSQIVFNTACRSSVVCQYRENREQFPFEPVYPMYDKRSLFAELDMLFARWRARYRASCSGRIIRQLKPDVIHGHFSYESWRHILAILDSRIPLVTTFYGLDISKLPRRKVWRKRYALLFKYGAAFIVEGEFMAGRLAALGCPLSKITCIPIGVQIDAIRAVPRRPNDAEARVLFTGLGREKKGALDAAAAFAAVAKNRPNVFFDLIGDGRYRRPARRVLKKAGILDRCVFHGSVPVARYLELLGAADIVLSPSVTASDGDTEGGAPVTAIEAQVAGVPVVGTLHGDIPMVVKNGETGFLCPEHDHATLAANLERLVADPGLRMRMGKAAALRGAQRHDIRKQVEKITKVYLKVTSGSSRQAAV
ncbi:MAG: glycosyltransferase [Chitinispirillaceae bacterium]|nr:glycosyltransferase [Chitinispirillaceae bacterium]